ncbi:3-oxoacyl-ACP reductase FabG [Pseudomonas sp. Kh13]|uniref:3-oxoacyl-ACP reductase FabG n=1 Tax=Pseudomonas sp. Kh13 TaxID=2093744 RepID=UPI001182A939|nr:3-oxoacyl-ACP reductase FabG [Pseudomonas sp. Kh13]
MNQLSTCAPRTLLVTGGSRGLGAAMVMELAARGHNVCFTYLNSREQAEHLAASFKPGQVMPVCADARDPSAIEQAVKCCVEYFGRLDGLVNNAGITQDRNALAMSAEQWHGVIDGNLHSAFHACKAVLPLFVEQGHGAIVNIASVSGLIGVPGQANYCASKAGLIGMTRSFAVEFASRGVRCNAVAPGFIDTDMTRKLNERRVAQMLERIPMRRFGDGQEVAKVVAFLLSDDAAYMTGQVLAVDGGLVA